MDAFVWVLLGGLAYLVIGRSIARGWYDRRHGMLFPGLFGPEMMRFLGIALSWPVSMVTTGVRRPEPCTDRECLLARARVRADHASALEEEQRLLDRYGDRRRDR